MTHIQAIAGALPDKEVTNAELARQHPAWGVDLVAELTGTYSRRIAAEGETAFDLSVKACESLFAQGDVRVEDIDAILYCTPNPDHPIPGNAHLMHDHLEMDDDVFAFDYTLACSGYVYGIAFADAIVRCGMASGVLLVTAETPSKTMHVDDRSVRTLFGDGAAATYITGDSLGGGGRIVAHELCSHGRGFEHVYIPAGGARMPVNGETKRETTDQSANVRTPEHVRMDGAELWAFVRSTVPRHVQAFLAKHSLTLSDIDLCVFHQASRLILSSLAKELAIPPEKIFVHMGSTGNMGSASIPFALRAALDDGAIGAGDRVLLTAFGGGISYGSAIVEF